MTAFPNRITGPAALALLVGLLSGCIGVEVNTAPTDRFEEAGYKSYSWRAAPLGDIEGNDDPLYMVDPALRKAVDSRLAEKGYQRRDSGGDFLIDYIFKASLADGALSSTADIADNRYPVPDPDFLVNRRANQALVDNAYALSGPREMNSVLIQFSDGETQGLIWAASISRMVENLNRDNVEQMRKGLNKAVNRALQPLPPAN